MAEKGGRRMVVIVLQSSMGLARWFRGLFLTWERTKYSQ